MKPLILLLLLFVSVMVGIIAINTGGPNPAYSSMLMTEVQQAYS